MANRAAWRVSQLGMNPKRVIFIDETWAKTNMTRLRGRCRIGGGLVEKVPHGHWKTTTLIAALDHSGIRCATTVDGAINTQVFEAFVAQVLVPKLSPGDIVVLDNLSSHKSVAARAQAQITTYCNISWFSTFLDLPCGIPSHDTFGRVFAHLEPQAFERRFCAWDRSSVRQWRRRCSNDRRLRASGDS